MGAVNLTERAVAALQAAAQVIPENPDLMVEERMIWQPDSWLLQRIGQALAEGGAGEAALSVAQMVEPRVPHLRAQTLYRLAQQVAQKPELAPLVRRELEGARGVLFAPWRMGEEWRQIERLLFYGASAALVDARNLALACLERADQWERVWDRALITPETRALLAQIVARVGLHPLTSQLIALAIRRYEDSGAQFLHQVAGHLRPRTPQAQLSRREARLLQRCVETFQFATLTSLTCRRLAAAVFGQAGKVHELLDQVVTIGNVQIARRDSGLSSSKGDPHFLRQVKRSTANSDVDFQVYTLQEAVRAMPVREIPRDQRIALADRLAELAVRSDGWTAAGASVSLIELGALRYAINTVDRIPPQDPTRSEGVISLVRALLAGGDPDLAAEQVSKALQWLKSLDKRNPERATIWGLAEVYLAHGMADEALRLLETRVVPPSLGERMRRTLRNRPTDDELRDNRLRFQARLQQGATWDKEMETLFQQLVQWGPRLLDGEMLMSLHMDGLLRPLLAAGRTDLVWQLLPQIRDALALSSGDKHTMQVQRIATLLATEAAPRLYLADAQLADAQLAQVKPAEVEPHAQNGATPDADAPTVPGAVAADRAAAQEALTRFLVELWETDVQKGLWQTIHGIEGSCPLLLALEGPQALLLLAQAVMRDGGEWAQTWRAPAG
jgi:tetratricopeptide (TPR) repeat protein